MTEIAGKRQRKVPGFKCEVLGQEAVAGEAIHLSDCTMGILFHHSDFKIQISGLSGSGYITHKVDVPAYLFRAGIIAPVSCSQFVSFFRILAVISGFSAAILSVSPGSFRKSYKAQESSSYQWISL